MTDKSTRGSAALRDLLFRADNAAKQLDILAQKDSNKGDYAAHLVSKAQGVRLVIGYVEEALRDDPWCGIPTTGRE